MINLEGILIRIILFLDPGQQLEPRLVPRPRVRGQVGLRNVYVPQLAEGAQVRAVLLGAEARLSLLNVAEVVDAVVRLAGDAGHLRDDDVGQQRISALHRLDEQSFRTSHYIFHTGE